MAKRVPVRDRELWSPQELADMLGCSRETIWDMERKQLLPPPVKVGPSRGMTKWRAQEIRDWTRAGCPEREYWTWKPTQLPKLEEQIQQKRRELASLEREIRQAEARLEGGRDEG